MSIKITPPVAKGASISPTPEHSPASGNPHWSDQVVRVVDRSLYQLTDLPSFAPLAAAQTTFSLGRWGLVRLLSQTLTRPMAGLLSSVGAFALEGLAFVGSELSFEKTRTLGATPNENFSEALKHAYLTMGLLRTFGGITNLGLQLGNWQNKLLFRLAPHLASFSGLFASQTLAPTLGLGEYLNPMDRLIQSGIATVHFGMAGHLLHHIPGYTQFHQQMQRETQKHLEKVATWMGSSGHQLVLETGGAGSPAKIQASPMDFSFVKMEGASHEGPPPLDSRSFSLEIQNEIGRTLRTFLNPKPSLSGRHFIPNLSDERVLNLEEIFEVGGRITIVNNCPWLVQLPSAAMTFLATSKVTREDITFYWLWKNHFGFLEPIEKEPTQVQGDNVMDPPSWGKFQKGLEIWKKIQKKAQDLEIKISQKLSKPWEIAKFEKQLGFILHILDLLPNSLLKTPNLRAINLFTERQDFARLSAFKNEELYLYYGLFFGSRRNMAGLLLHELGHASDKRYLPGDLGDPNIPETIRDKMREAHRTIADHQAFLGLDFAGGPEYRQKYQKELFGEFIADLHLTYVAAGPLLREHIASFPKDSPAGQAWNFVYSELRDRIFGGREYDYLPSAEPKPETVPLWHLSHDPELTKTTSKNLRSMGHWEGVYHLPAPDGEKEFILGRWHFPTAQRAQNISKKHLKLFRFEDFYFVQDLGSKHGTTVKQADGTTVLLKDSQRKPSAPYPIMPGDRILLAGIELEIDFNESQSRNFSHH